MIIQDIFTYVAEEDFDYLSPEFIMKYSSQYLVPEKGDNDRFLRYTISNSALPFPLFMMIPEKKNFIDSEAVDDFLISLEASPSSFF